MAADRRNLAAVRKLLGTNDAASVRQGLELANTLADIELWTTFAEGVSVTPDWTPA